MQEGGAQRSEAGARDVGAGLRRGDGRRLQLEEVRAEGHPRRQVPQVSTSLIIIWGGIRVRALLGGGVTYYRGSHVRRSYFRCTHRNTRGCLATRHVQRADADPLLFDVVYHGAHTCGVQKAAHGQQPAGHERSSPRVVEATGGGVQLQAGFEPVTPHSFSSAPAADFDPLLSPASFDWQLRGGGLGAGMEFDQQQFDDLFSGPPDSFRWDI
jgi:hypothetical protein